MMRICTLVLAIVGADLFAQAPYVLVTVNGPVPSEQLAAQNGLAGLGDIDGDLVPDFVAGAPSWPAPHPTIVGATIAQVGKARVYSGASMTQLFDVTGTYNLQALGRSVANVGDLDADGRADFAVGAPMYGPTVPGAVPPVPQVQVWSSGTASLLYTIAAGAGGFSSPNFGFAIAGAGDVGQVVGGVYLAIQDGIPDLLVGAPAGNAAAVYSGANGALMYVIDAASINLPAPTPPFLNPNEDFGGGLAGGRDITGDGIPDLLVAARLSALGGSLSTSTSVVNAGAVFVLSGAGGGLVQAILGAPGDGLGQSVAFIDDLDGDSVTDFAVGATRTDVGGADSGSVSVYSGATRALIWTANGLLAAELFGYAVSAAGDFNDDGISEILVGTPTTDVGASNTGSVTLLDGATGARAESLHGLAATDLLGRSVAAFGDGDGDGYPEVLAGAPAADVGGASTGTVSLVSFGPHLRPGARGAIPDPATGTYDAILINGQSGGAPRRVDVFANQSFTISFAPPPGWPIPAPAYLFLMVGIPGASDALLLPGLGTLLFAPPILNPIDPRLFLFSNSFAPFDPSALVPTTPTGPFSIPIPGGLPSPIRIALTGVTSDGLSIGIANTILLNVR